MGTYKEDFGEMWNEFKGARETGESSEATGKAADLAIELGKGAVAVAGVGGASYAGMVGGLALGAAATAGLAAAPIAVPVFAACVGLGVGTGLFSSKTLAERYFNSDTADRRKVESIVRDNGLVRKGWEILKRL